MNTVFIADLHLSPSRPDITKMFLHFLETELKDTKALYILGDLFEIWVGDDLENEATIAVATALQKLSASGIPCYFIHGNRDFMLGKDYAKQAGITLLPEKHLLDLYGEPTLIMHGDTLCTRDEAYQNYRKWVYKPWLQWLFRAMPLFIRKKIGGQIRSDSSDQKQAKTYEIMDVTPEEVVKELETFAVQRLIHGHTHRPAVHELETSRGKAQRIVLGDWYEQGSLLIVDANGYQLKRLES